MTIGPQLSMLWESVDPADALMTRFGFTDAEAAGSWLQQTVSGSWARPAERCERLVISASNLLAWLVVDGQHLIAKCSANPARFSALAGVDALVAWLDSAGIPVAAPIAASESRLRIERDGISLGLYPVVEGDLLDVANTGQVQAAGRMLAMLHEALAGCPLTLDAAQTRSNQQLVHGDFRSANILNRDTTIAAVLDFDDVGYGTRSADLAKAAVLLGTRYHDWRPTTPETREAFLDAYGEVAPLTGRQRDEMRRGIAATLDYFGWT